MQHVIFPLIVVALAFLPPLIASPGAVRDGGMGPSVQTSGPGTPLTSCPFCATPRPESAPFAASASGINGKHTSIYALSDSWETDTGSEFKLDRLSGRPAVVALFYTTCHVACPVTVQTLSDVDRALPADSSVAIILVTIDPKIDTSRQLAQCRSDHRLSDRILLLRGTPAGTRALADAAGIVFRRDTLRLIHVPKIVVLDKNGNVTASFPGLQLNGAEIARSALKAEGTPAAVAANR